jgi:hypothetical protein
MATTPVSSSSSSSSSSRKKRLMSSSSSVSSQGEGTGGSGSSKRVKFGVQLFKLTSGRYLLDFKKLGGDTFGFFNCCSVLLVHLSQTITDEKK